MLASKYFPHYLALIFIYYFLPLNRKEYPPLCRRDFVLLLGTCALVFLIANPVILAPHYPIHAALRWGRHDDPSRLLDDGTFLFQ